MSREILNAINVSLDGYSVLISLIIVVSLFALKKIDDSAKWFALTNIAALLYGGSDIFTWISEGTDAAWKLFALPVATFIFYLSGCLLFLFYLRYIIVYYSHYEKLSNKWWYFCILLGVLYSICTIISPFTGFFYYIDENNIYHRGHVFIVSVIIELIFYLEALLLVIKFHNKMSNAENIGFASFIFCPFISQVIQIANYGIALNSLGLTISFFIIYINMHHRLRTRIQKSEEQLSVIDNKLSAVFSNTIFNLANLIEFNETGNQHTKRITLYAKRLAKTCKKDELYEDIIDDQFVKNIEKASALHDLGHMSIPRPILNKHAKVTPEEFERIKTHCEIGSDMVNQILSVGYDREFVKMASDICKYHHERWDGTGYPNKIRGKEIPLCARIVAIVDVFDALVTPRCYKKTVSYDEAFRIIDNESGKHFDPELVMEFLKVKNKIVEITKTYSDSSYED